MDMVTDLMSTNSSELSENITLSHDGVDGTNMEWMKELEEEVQSIHNFASTFTAVTISILLALGIPGNCLVIYVSLSSQRVINHPVHSMLVINLALSDIIYLLCSAPYQAIAFSVPSWIFGSTMCPIFYFLSSLTMAASIFTICSLAVMRFVGLMMPFQVHTSFIRTSAKFTGWLIIGLVWIFATILALPDAVSYRLKYQYETSLHSAAECAWEDSKAKKKYVIAVMILTFLAPFLLVTILYFFVGRELLCVMSPNRAAGKDADRSDYWKTTKLVCGLVIAFVVCWFPQNLYLLLMLLPKYQEMKYLKLKMVAQICGYCLSYAHACVNPIIYTFGVSTFRHSVYVTLKLKKLRKLGVYVSNKCPKCCSNSQQNSKSSSNSVELNTLSSFERTSLTPASSFHRDPSKKSILKLLVDENQSPLKENLLTVTEI